MWRLIDGARWLWSLKLAGNCRSGPAGPCSTFGPFVYMNKLAVGPEAKGVINIEKSISENLQAIAKAKGKDVEDLTTIILDRAHPPPAR